MRQSDFKTYQRGRRQSTIDDSFLNGMMFTNSTVDEGYVKTLVNYDIKKEGKLLEPRSGLRLSELLFSDFVREADDIPFHNDSDITIMAAKDCIKNEVYYKQFILGKPSEDGKTGTMWVCVCGPSEYNVTNELESAQKFSVDYTFGEADVAGMPCTFFTTPLSKVHNMEMVPESKNASIVGTFAFGDRFYFIHPEEGLKYTNIDRAPKCSIFSVTPKELDPSEAVTYGYNMLAGEDAYSFINEALEGTLQLTGILPYSTQNTNTLLLTPHHNEDLLFRCYFKGTVGKSYKFTWEWRNVGEDSWQEIQSLEKATAYTITNLSGNKVGLSDGDETLEHLEVSFKAPTSDILVRVQAFNTDDLSTVEKAMTVGFNFSNESYGATSNLQQKSYDLKTATGMTYWKNRLVLWGIPEDPTILFMSDVNEPAYFPYPNNISMFNEPINCVKEFMDGILVFTTTSIYLVELNEDGVSWSSTLLQSNLNIEVQDRHLIQIVRNMVFFKSGDYYYMLVPKAQSTTGQLTLAPISNSIVEFFNYFETNVLNVLKDTFDFDSEINLIHCFNFLDYEDVHNMYVFSFDNTKTGSKSYLHFDLLYNTVSRTWRIYTFEAPHYLFPYKQDATKRGVLATTSLFECVPTEDSLDDYTRFARNIQLFTFDKLVLQDFYIPEKTSIVYRSYITNSDGHIKEACDLPLMQDVLITVCEDVPEQYRFHNWQFLDTGYRDNVLERNKRYRELQFQISNTDGKNLDFGLEFQIDGQKRVSYFKYTVEHVTDENDPNYGLIYVQAVPIMNLPVIGNSIPNTTVLGEDTNSWTLNQSAFPEVTLWKIRAPVSGKGMAPRIRLISRNVYRYELMNINWIYRLMNMR